MSWLTEHQRLIGRCAWVAAWVGLVVGQLHALSRFATAEGAEDLALPATAAWAVPAAEVLSPLLGWGDADLVYVTYGKISESTIGGIAAVAKPIPRLISMKASTGWRATPRRTDDHAFITHDDPRWKEDPGDLPTIDL